MSGDTDVSWRLNLFVCVFGSFATVFAMTLVLPFLPAYLEQLGVHGYTAIVQWAGIAYSASFVTAGLVAVMWGHVGDRFGWKLMLVRASLGMAITVFLMGFATNIWQFVGLRLAAGIAGGYSSAAMVLVAVQTPKHQTAWALGLLSLGVMGGNLLGPLAGGFLPSVLGLRPIFWGAGGLILIAFLATLFLIRETPRSVIQQDVLGKAGWSLIEHKTLIVSMLLTGLLFMIGNRSIEPILAVYVASLIGDQSKATAITGIVMAAAAVGSMLSALKLGSLADRTAPSTVIIAGLIAAALSLIPQAFASELWQLLAARFCMGLALGGLLPCIATVIRHNVPDGFVGTVMGYSLAAQFAGQVIGPLVGGFVAAHLGMTAVFLGTSALLLLGATFNWQTVRLRQR